MPRRVLRWVADWRNGLTLVASVLVALLALITIDGISGRRQAVEALRVTAERNLSAQQAASRRIDLLNAQISDLTDVATTNGHTIGELVGDIHALEAQVRALGAQPVVVLTTTTTAPKVTTTTSTTAQGRNLPTATTSTTSTTAAPATTTTTSKHCVLPINPSCK